ncbi:MAG TPA: amino acid permease [Isosphaeraceae bacterium]|jgi:amino acid transporter
MMRESPPPAESAELPRVLGPIAALCVVVGSVIGSGIFIVPARVAQSVPSIGGIAFVWVVGGLFSLAGALTLAELGAMLPRAGGPYVYLRAAYGDLPAFLFGWTEFLVIRAGSMATLAAAFALYVAQLVPPPGAVRGEVWQMAIAATAMAAVAAVNVAGTELGGRVQVVGTALKVAALGAMIVAPFVLGKAHAANLTPVWPAALDRGTFAGVMLAMVGVLWTYDGWVNTSALAEEIRDPGRNVPRALGWGMAVLIAIYLAMTLAYHLVLPLTEVAASATEKGSPRVVAAVYCRRLLGPAGLATICLVVSASTLISLNGNALSGPRAYFALARDGHFPRALGRVHPRFQTPANAILAQAAWAIALTVAGTALIVGPAPGPGLPRLVRNLWGALREKPIYDVMFAYVIFGGTVIYALTISSVFVLRARRPELPRPYRAWGYPVTPVLYVLASLLLMGNMLADDRSRSESLAGLGIILLGVPAYWLFSRRATALTPGRPRLGDSPR